MNNKKSPSSKLEKASITVEACMVVPVVLFVVFTLLSLCFYVHNRAWYTAAVREIAVTAGTEAVKKDTNAGPAMNTKISELNGLCGFPDWCQGISGVYQDPVITVAAEAEIPFLMAGSSYSMKVKANVKVIRPVSFIRTVQAAEIIMEEL